jgi:hypothetical protein
VKRDHVAPPHFPFWVHCNLRVRNARLWASSGAFPLVKSYLLYMWRRSKCYHHQSDRTDYYTTRIRFPYGSTYMRSNRTGWVVRIYSCGRLYHLRKRHSVASVVWLLQPFNHRSSCSCTCFYTGPCSTNVANCSYCTVHSGYHRLES